MPAGFDSFYENQSYRRYKKYLFSYLLRKRRISAFIRQSASPVLEIGCGIAPMAPDGVKTFLGDKSFIAMKAMSHDGHSPIVLDIKQLGIQSESVAQIVCSEVLEHINDDRKAIQEMYRVLRSDGRLILTVPLHQHYWRRDDEIVGHYRRYELLDLKKALEANGFKVISTAKIGSWFERYLTLAVVLTFLKANKSSSQFTRISTTAFSVVNRLLARLLQLASVVSPEQWNSVSLLYCAKK